MTFLRRSRRHYALIGISVLLLVPIAMAIFAPLLAPIPTQADGWTAPPLPQRDQQLPGFQGLLEPLPLMVRDLPDAESQKVIALYDATSFTDHQSAMQMLADAEAAVPVPSSLASTWKSWVNDWQGDTVPYAVLDVLRNDPQNADRLSNLAMAMYFAELTIGPDGNIMTGGRVGQASQLLEATVMHFPGSRAPLLNSMFLSSASYL